MTQQLQEQFARLKGDFQMFTSLFEAQFPALLHDTIARQAETDDWVSRVVANGGSVNATTESAVDAFVAGCKADGIWTAINRINLFAGTGLSAVAVPLVVGLGSALDTLQNFVSGDYSESIGLTGNGSTKYVNTGLLANALTTHSTHLTVVSHKTTYVDGVHGASAGASSYFGMYAPFTDGLIYDYQYNQTAGGGRLAVPSTEKPVGVITATRTSSSYHAVYDNGVLVGSNTTSGGSLPARAIYIFANDASGTAANYRNDIVSAYTIGSGLSALEARMLANRLITFCRDLGRWHWGASDQIVGAIIHPTNLNGPEDIHLDGTVAYVPCRDGGTVTAIDVSDKENPVILSAFTNAALTQAIGIDQNGTTLYVASWHNRTLLCIDATNPSSMSLLGSVQLGTVEGGGDPDELRKLVYYNGHIHACHNFDQKLFVVDVSNPASPSITTSLALGIDAFAIARKGNHLFITPFPGSTMKVVDISTPGSPSIVASIACPSGVGSMEVVGDTLWACGFSDNKIEAFDITSPASISSLGSTVIAAANGPNRIHVSGSRAFVASATGDAIVVLDITNPTAITVEKTRGGAILDQCYDIDIDGGYIYAVGRAADSFIVMRMS